MWQKLDSIRWAIGQMWMLRRGPETIQKFQQQRLRKLVSLAKARSPFYAEHLRHIDPEHFELHQLPTLTKSQMMENFDRVLTRHDLSREVLEEVMSDPSRLGEWFRDQFALTRTSGTQGMKALIVQDREMMRLMYALQMTRGSVFSTSISAIVSRLFVKARVATVTIGSGFYPTATALAHQSISAKAFATRIWIKHIEPISDVVHQLNEFQPHVLVAYANVLEVLALEAKAGRLKLNGNVRQVINISEPISPGTKRRVQEAFGLRVTDTYAMGECMALSVGCPQHQAMHLNADWAILEVVDRHYRPVEPGQPGERVLVTNLYNDLQPFIRYEIDDVVTMSPTPCPCGSPLPVIQKVEGRRDEVVWIRAGEEYQRVHPYVFVDVLDECPEIGWFQIVQVERNRFLLRATPTPGRHINRDDLHNFLQRGLQRFQLAALVEFDVEITDALLPKLGAGKVKRIASQVGPPTDARLVMEAMASA